MKLEEVKEFVEYVKYNVESIDIILENETIEFNPAFVYDILFEYNYDDLYAPIMSISLALTQEEYKKIVKEKDIVRFKVRMTKNHYNDEHELLRTSEFLNEILCTHILDETPLLEKEILSKTKANNNKDSDDDTRSPMDMRDIFDFALFKENNISSGHTDLNMAIKSASMNDLIVYVLTSAGLSNVLMTPSDNTSTISNMICPLMNTIDTINYLQSIKGIYNNGVMFFMDYNLIYFIDKNAYCTAWRKNEYKLTNIFILSQKSPFNTMIGQYINTDNENNNIFTNTDAININNKSLVNNVIAGNTTLLMNPKSNSVNMLDANLKQRGVSNVKLSIQKHTNKYATNEEKVRLRENEYNLDVILEDIDLDIISPNKCFKLIFQDTDLTENYGGTYRISRTIMSLTKMGNELDSHIIVSLKKQNNNVNEFGGGETFEDWYISESSGGFVDDPGEIIEYANIPDEIIENKE